MKGEQQNQWSYWREQMAGLGGARGQGGRSGCSEDRVYPSN